MEARLRACAAGTALAALFGALPSARADLVEPLTIHLVVVDYAHVPGSILSHAKAEAARIYRSLGISVVWSNGPVPSIHPRIIVKIVCQPIGEAGSLPQPLAVRSANWRVLGIVPGHQAGQRDRRDLVAWAFYNRIVDFTTILGVHGLDAGVLLGHVIAHEVGHLLLPYDAHSQTGLMRPGWDKSLATNAAMGNLSFTPGESALVRRSVAKMNAAGQSSLTSASPIPHAAQPGDRSSSHLPIAAR